MTILQNSISRLATIAAVSLLLAVFSASSTHAATPPDSCFAFNAGTNTITDYYDHEDNIPANPACTRDVDIPSTIGGVPVVTLGTSAFSNNQLTSVTIPSSVTTLGGASLAGNLFTTITIPTSVTSIGNSTFGGGQLTSVVVPSSVTTIASSAFNSNRLTTAVIENASATMNHNIFYNNPIESLTVGATTYTEQSPTTDPACFSISANRTSDYYQASPLVARDNGVMCGRNIAVPDGVTVIGGYSFYYNQLSAVTFPDSVIEVEDYAFWSNKIDTLDLGTNITTIGQHAFLMNSISSLTVPSSLTSIGIGAFALQSPWGTNIEDDDDRAPYVYSTTPSIVQQVYDAVWYVRLYTSDPSNPAGLLSSASHEDSWVGSDANANGYEDSIGGHIINPARATIQYRNAADQTISTTQNFTGMIDDTYLNDYLVTNGPLVPVPADSYSPTPAELTAIDDAFDVYYRLGDTVTIDPPAIDGYITPEPQTFVLGAADNTFSYVYAAADSPGGGAPATPVSDEDELADTGISSIVYAVSALAMTSLGALILTRRV